MDYMVEVKSLTLIISKVSVIHYAAFTTAEVWLMFSSSFWKLSLVFNLEYLSQLFINFNNQWQFWNPHDKQITKLSLIFKLDAEITKIIGNDKEETKSIFQCQISQPNHDEQILKFGCHFKISHKKGQK